MESAESNWSRRLEKPVGLVILGLGIFVQQLPMNESMLLGAAFMTGGVAWALVPELRRRISHGQIKWWTVRLLITLPFLLLLLFFVRMASSHSEKDRIRFDQASTALQSSSPQGRSSGYLRLVALIDSEWSDAAILAIIQALALEDDDAIRTGVVSSLRSNTVAQLDRKARQAAVDLSIALIRELSVDKEHERRRSGLVTVLGTLLTGFKTQGLDFSLSNLDGLSVTDCSLRNSSFNHSSLVQVRIEECDISGSTFIGGLIDASFSGSSLRNVSFAPSLFRPSEFVESDLTGARIANYSLVEYDYTYYPGFSAIGSFRGAELEDVVFERAAIFVILPAPGEMPAEPPSLIRAAQRYKTPDDFRMGLSYGIHPPFRVDSKYQFRPSLIVPLTSILHLSTKGDRDLRENLPHIREFATEQFDDLQSVTFEDDRIGQWLITGRNNLR